MNEEPLLNNQTVPRSLEKSIARYTRKLASKKVEDVVDNLISRELITAYRLNDNLRRMSQWFNGGNGEHIYFFKTLEIRDLEHLILSPPLNSAGIVWSIKIGLLPTPNIFQLLRENRVKEIAEAQADIKDGKFQKSNLLHLELEYSRCLQEGEFFNGRQNTFKEFAAIPEFAPVILGASKRSEIEGIAEYNLKLLSLIQSEALKGEVLVVFNKRYGTYWCGDLLREFISLSNVTIKDAYVGSFQWDNVSRGAGGDPSAPRYSYFDEASKAGKTVLVVDGTPNCRKYIEGQLINRFPAAMRGFKAALEEDFDLRFWCPDNKFVSETFLGGDRVEVEEGSSGRPKAILINITGEDVCGSFDDPEDFIGNQEPCFGEYGLTSQPVAQSEDQFKNHVQPLIIAQMRDSLS